MITQPDPQLEARPAVPAVEHRLPLHLPGWAHRRPVPQSTRATGTRPLNIALVGLQLLLGYEWLLAGGDKFLLGAFPAQLGGLLSASVHGGHLVGFFVAILQGLVAPNAVLFGYLIESGETLAGLGLMTAGLVALLRPLAGRSLSGTSATLFAYGDRLLQRRVGSIKETCYGYHHYYSACDQRNRSYSAHGTLLCHSHRAAV